MSKTPRDRIEHVASGLPVDRVAARVVQRGVPDIDHGVSPGAYHSHAPLPVLKAPRDRSFVDLTGVRSGRLTVIGYVGNGGPAGKRQARWLVRCQCSIYETRSSAALKNTANVGDRCRRCRKWARAHWCLYDMVFNGVPRLDTFRKIVALGISRRAAAEAIHDCEREG